MTETVKKRIVLVAKHPVGGILTFFSYIYGHELFDEYDFTVVVPSQYQIQDSLRKIFSKRELVYIPFESTTEMIIKTWNYLRENKVSLIHSHGFSAGLLMVPVAKYTKVPHIVTTHDVFQDVHFAGIVGGLKKITLSFMFSYMDAIHTVGQEATSNFKEYFPSICCDKIHCISNGIDTEEFYYAKPNKDYSKLREPGNFLIGFFGRFMSQKGFKDLIDAIDIITRDNLSGVNPVVLTYGWGGYIREDYMNIESRGLNEYFHMLPYTDDMPITLKNVDLVVMPSLWEACPLLAMEALVAGVPIVGTNCIGLNEVLEGTPAVRISPKDPQSLARAIANEMNHPRKEEFIKYSPVARQRFSLVTPTKELKKLYQRLIA